MNYPYRLLRIVQFHRGKLIHVILGKGTARKGEREKFDKTILRGLKWNNRSEPKHLLSCPLPEEVVIVE